MHSVGNQIGVGKESGESNSQLLHVYQTQGLPQDIYIVADAEGNEMVLKLHRYRRLSV
jgi:RIO-like serine/threonine protein kinase